MGEEESIEFRLGKIDGTKKFFYKKWNIMIKWVKNKRRNASI